jgi:hypothetical protein
LGSFWGTSEGEQGRLTADIGGNFYGRGEAPSSTISPDAYLEWALKARNARDGWHLEIPAVQLITPNLPDAANYEAERERGQDFESHHHS